MSTAAFGATFAALFAAHTVADHWVQTQHQATTKGFDGWAGRVSCAAHVATYTATAVLALVAVHVLAGLPLNPSRVAAGLTVSAVTHYLVDRRTPLRRMCQWLGKDTDWLERGGGFYAMDQSWHIGWLFAAALIIAGGAA